MYEQNLNKIYSTIEEVTLAFINKPFYQKITNKFKKFSIITIPLINKNLTNII